MRNAKQQYLRRAELPAALWSIEKGALSSRLHLNILAPQHHQPELKNASIWQAKIKCTPREMAAYLGKQYQMPSPADYTGRLWGTCGNVTSYLASASAQPHIQAAAAEILIRSTVADPMTKPQSANQHCNERLTPDQYRAIRERHLPNLRALLDAKHSGE